jgi:hypothetical protein
MRRTARSAMRRTACWIWAGLLAAVLGGCGRAPAPPDADVVRQSNERGPIKFEVTARPKEVWLGDPIEIDLQVHTPEDYVVEFPTAKDLGDLSIRGEEAPDPRPAPEGGLEWRHVFRVESLSSGTLEIPELSAKYGRKPEDADETIHFENELQTERLKIEVRSALTTQDSLLHPRDITGTLSPKPSLKRVVLKAVLIAVSVAAIAGAGVLAWLWLRRRRRNVPPVAPELLALQALEQLGRRDWIEVGRARDYYYELTEIVRAYIERKFSLAAPEMTTEEFLNALARKPGALPYDSYRLRAFLEACDLVKYAAFSPLRTDADQALMTARAFVHETAAAVQRAQLARMQQQQAAAEGQVA